MLIWGVCVESISGAKIQFEDFARVYGEQLDRKLEFTTLEDSSMLQETSITSMTNAIKTFDHQGTGFISLNELKFSKAQALIFKLKKIILVLTGLGDKLKDEEFAELKQFMEISPNGQVSYERKS